MDNPAGCNCLKNTSIVTIESDANTIGRQIRHYADLQSDPSEQLIAINIRGDFPDRVIFS